MKKIILSVLAGLVLFGQPVSAESVTLPPYQETMAYKYYQRRPKTELSKLIYVMDRFRNTEYKVVYDKVEYTSTEALKFAKEYVAKHYKNENAIDWISENAYRSSSGKLIYLKEPDGKTKVLKDALIEEVKILG